MMQLARHFKQTQFCSFCSKSQHQVEWLFAAPEAMICTECVEVCNEVVENLRWLKKHEEYLTHEFGPVVCGSNS